MNLLRKPAQSAAPAADFDLLRARLEGEVERPGVIAITSSTAEDGREVAARGLAHSLASAGYRTILIDTTSTGYRLTKSATDFDLEEVARQLVMDPRSTQLSVLNLSDPAQQKKISQRDVRSAFSILCEKFDYVVVNTEPGSSTSFGMSIVSAANAVFVTIKKGRREKNADIRLAEALQRPGVSFLGVLALDPSMTVSDPAIFAPTASTHEVRHAQPVHAEKAYVVGK